jgi:hypothetical protein
VKFLARRDRLPASLSPERPASSSRHWTIVSGNGWRHSERWKFTNAVNFAGWSAEMK